MTSRQFISSNLTGKDSKSRVKISLIRQLTKMRNKYQSNSAIDALLGQKTYSLKCGTIAKIT
ncbi:hypothetical protein ACHJH3_11175, partial [Campylobacter sp. MOP7]|uniref:hypothetical protein n=1 Tax=Campylobacter canis TaxID=3378588 RepID=UPI00387ED554